MEISSTKYFKAYMRNHLNNEYIVYGVAFEDMGETVESKALHIAKVRGYGTLTLIKFDLYKNGEDMDNAQYSRIRQFNEEHKIHKRHW
jgi:hypothetical protein